MPGHPPMRNSRRWSGETLLESLSEDVLRQIDADEHHFANFWLVFGPFGPKVAPHELVHALEDDLPVSAVHVEHALVAQHARAVDLDDGAKEIFQLRWLERTLGPQ